MYPPPHVRVINVQDPWQVLHLEVMHAPKLDEKHGIGHGKEHEGSHAASSSSALTKTDVKIDRTGSGDSEQRHVKFKVCNNSHKSLHSAFT